MKRWVLTLFAAALLTAAAPFDKKLSKDQQIVHVLNRLTFSARPGDIEEVRRLGVEKWIELQLHPDRIPENPALETKLKPLETLRMTTAEIMEAYRPTPVGGMRPMLNTLLQPDQVRRLFNGTAEERQAVLKPLDPEKRRQVLATVAPGQFSSFPELQKEAEEARKSQQEEFQKEL